MKELYLELFNYNHFMNNSLIECLIANEKKVQEKSRKLIGHMLSAHHIWNSRIDGVSPKYKVWDIHPLHELKFIDKNNFEFSCIIIDNLDEERMIGYVNSQGVSYTNKVTEVLFHIVNHSTYHRGQIAADLRAAGITPPVTDYIFYKR